MMCNVAIKQKFEACKTTLDSRRHPRILCHFRPSRKPNVSALQILDPNQRLPAQFKMQKLKGLVIGRFWEKKMQFQQTGAPRRFILSSHFDGFHGASHMLQESQRRRRRRELFVMTDAGTALWSPEGMHLKLKKTSEKKAPLTKNCVQSEERQQHSLWLWQQTDMLSGLSMPVSF